MSDTANLVKCYEQQVVIITVGNECVGNVLKNSSMQLQHCLVVI